MKRDRSYRLAMAPRRGSPPARHDRIAWKTHIWRSRETAWDLATLKCSGDPKLVAALLPDLLTSEKTRKLIAPNPFPKAISDIQTTSRLDIGSLEQELDWIANILVAFQDRLTAYLRRRFSLEKAICAGRTADAAEALTTIEADFGQSLWSIETRTYLIGVTAGLDAQKEFARTLRTTMPSTLWCAFSFITIA